MKLLTFAAARFGWKTFSKTLDEVEDVDVSRDVEDAIVVFMHVESRDVEQESRAFKHTLKHIKWLANKRGWRRVAGTSPHSRTHALALRDSIRTSRQRFSTRSSNG